MLKGRTFKMFLVGSLLFSTSFLYGPASCSAKDASETASETASEKAADNKTDTATGSIDSDKKAAIDELIEVTELNKRIELIKQSFWRNAQRAFRSASLNSLRKDAQFKDVSSDQLLEAVNKKADILAEKYKDLFNKRIDLDVLVKKVATDVYAKYFSAQEIRDIIAFYKTSTGRKARELMPKIAAESMRETQELMQPDLKEIVKEVLADLAPSESKTVSKTESAGESKSDGEASEGKTEKKDEPSRKAK